MRYRLFTDRAIRRRGTKRVLTAIGRPTGVTMTRAPHARANPPTGIREAEQSVGREPRLYVSIVQWEIQFGALEFRANRVATWARLDYIKRRLARNHTGDDATRSDLRDFISWRKRNAKMSPLNDWSAPLVGDN